MTPSPALHVRVRPLVAAVLMAGAIPCALTAAAQTQAPTIGVQAGHYVLAGRAVDDLDVLESDVRAAGARALRFDVCDPAATRALLAAAHRFSDGPLSFRFVDAAAQSCAGTALALPIGQRIGPKPFGIDDAEVQRYWQRLAP